MWYSTKNNKEVRPDNGDSVLIAVWYDGWNYETGMYIKEEDSIMLYDAARENDCTRLTFDDFEAWMKFEEPDISI